MLLWLGLFATLHWVSWRPRLLPVFIILLFLLWLLFPDPSVWPTRRNYEELVVSQSREDEQ